MITQQDTGTGRHRLADGIHPDMSAFPPGGRHRAEDDDTAFTAVQGDLVDEPGTAFFDDYDAATAEHTAELAVLSVPAFGVEHVSELATRAARWFRRNLTTARASVLAASAGVLVGTGVGAWFL